MKKYFSYLARFVPMAVLPAVAWAERTCVNNDPNELNTISGQTVQEEV